MLKNAVPTGIDHEPILPELVPLYQEREAAKFSLYNWTDWRNLSPTERGLAVAHYRISHVIGLHQQDAVDHHVEVRKRKQQAGSRNGR